MLSHFEDADLTLQLTDFGHHVVHCVPTWHFRMLHSSTGEELGGINLRIGSTPHIERYAGHIGFTLNSEVKSISEVFAVETGHAGATSANFGEIV